MHEQMEQDTMLHNILYIIHQSVLSHLNSIKGTGRRKFDMINVL